MKTRQVKAIFVAVACSLGAPGVGRATESPANVAELTLLDRFLCLADAELDQMARVIERLRTLSAAERVKLREEIARFRRLPAAQRAQLRRGWGWQAPELQEAWREMMQDASPERRAEIQAKLQALAPEARAACRRRILEDYRQSKRK
jgi:hypothetical protein